jgi:phage shock protein PspC (stress-responsive transcriptional regulator)
VSRGARAPLLPPRAGNGRLLGGVCAGVARALTLDVTLVRLAFMLLVFAWGFGLFAYVALWLVMPDADTPSAEGGWRQRARRRARGVRRDVGHWGDRLAQGWQEVGRDPWPRPLGRRWMAIALVGGGGFVLLASLGAFSWLTPLRAASLALMLVGAGTLISMRTPSERQRDR